MVSGLQLNWKKLCDRDSQMMMLAHLIRGIG